MKTSRQQLSPTLLILLAAACFAQQARPPQLYQAHVLSEQGQQRAAIALLEPLVQSDSHIFDEAARGIAWHLLGSAWQDFDDYDKARRCDETAIRILRAIPSEPVEYASALDALAAIEGMTGNLDASKALRFKARRIYQSAGNHEGIATTSTNLALVAIHQHNLRAARENLSEAFRETKLANDFPGTSLAMTYAVQGALAAAQHDPSAAIAAYQQAIDLWTSSRGAAYSMLAAAYVMRGIAFDLLGDHQAAIYDLRSALARLEQTPGRGTPTYLAVEHEYARILRNAGAKDEAAQVEAEAKTMNANLRQPQCNGCTISVESFR